MSVELWCLGQCAPSRFSGTKIINNANITQFEKAIHIAFPELFAWLSWKIVSSPISMSVPGNWIRIILFGHTKKMYYKLHFKLNTIGQYNTCEYFG